MAMGSTGTVNITPKMLTDAIGVIADYKTKTDGLHERLTETVNTLIPGSFSGSAADGYLYFYQNRIEPVIGSNLTSLITTLQDIAQGILESIPYEEGLDDQLGTGNRQ
jgi:uncharacterized protein YukE